MPGPDGGRGGAALAGLWSAAGSLAAPALHVLLAWRLRGGKEIAARLPERRGIDPVPRPPGRLIWMHAASVGETISILPVVQALRAAAPELTLLLTTGTVSSASIAAARLPGGALHRFVPLDVPGWMARFLDRWRPDAACMVESEIWPNLLGALAARRIPTALLNARLSAASCDRWRRVLPLARRLFGGFDLVWARSRQDADRLAVLAGRPIDAPGDLKFAAGPLPADAVEMVRLQAALAGQPVWTAASLHPGEDAIVTGAHDRLVARHPGLVTIIVPRHPGRGAAMAAAYSMPRRSLGEAPVPGRPYLADTLGELGLFYRLGCCALVGGSLVAHGGQNPLEPARLGVPVAMGPHTDNFAEACQALGAAGALAPVGDAGDLADWVDRMLSGTPARIAAGQAGCAAAAGWEDLPERCARALLGLLP